MNKLLLLGLIGGGMYWLFRDSARQPAYLEDLEDRDDLEGSGASSGIYDQEIAPPGSASHDQDLLDEAIAESFPASDPPSVSRPPA